MSYSEYLKKHNLTEQKNETYNEYVNRMQTNKVNSFIESYNRMIGKYTNLSQTDLSKYGDYSSIKKEYSDLNIGLPLLKANLDSIKNYISEENYNKFSKNLTDIQGTVKNNIDTTQSAIDYYGNFENEGQYTDVLNDVKFSAQYGELTPQQVKDKLAKYQGIDALSDEDKALIKWLSNYDITHGVKNESYYTETLKALKNEKGALEWKVYNYSLNQPAMHEKEINDINSRLEEINSRISQLNSARTRYKNEQVFEDKGYSKYLDAADFEEYKKSGQEIHNNEYIEAKDWSNKNWDQKNLPTENLDQLIENVLPKLKDEEKGVYFYLLAKDKKEGTKTAENFLKDMENTASQRLNDDIAEAIKSDMSAGGFEGTLAIIGYNALSIPANIVGGVPAVLGAAGDLIAGEDINVYGNSYALVNFANTVRGTTGEMIGNDGWNLVYQSLMSAADSFVGATAFGNAYPIIMATTAASNRAKELVEQGASDGQIILGALASGLIEMATEKFSVENFLDNIKPTTFKQWMLSTIQQAGIEASEEVASEILNKITDEAIRGSMSDYNQLVRKYMQEEGLSEAEAKKKAAQSAFKDIYEAALGGIISGGAMGGAGGMVQMSNYKAVGNAIISKGEVETVLLAAESMGKLDPEIAGQTEALKNYTKNSKNNAQNNATYKRMLGKIAVTTAQNSTQVKQNLIESAVKNELSKNKVNGKLADKIIKAVSKYVTGDKMSSSDQGYVKHNSAAGEILRAISSAQEAVKGDVSPATDNSSTTSSAPEWAVELVNRLNIVDSATEIVNAAVTGKTKEEAKTQERNRMIKLLSIASGKTTAQQEAEAGDIPYSQYIKQKEAEQKENTAENGGEDSNGSDIEISEADRKKQAERKDKVKSLCDLFGLSLEWDESIKRGKYNPNTRTVFINPNLTLTEMYIEVLKHEFTHDLENRRLYKSFKEFLFGKSINFRDYCETALKNDYGEELKGDEAIKRLTELKYRDYMSSDEMSDKEKAAFDNEAAEREIVADFVANRLLGGIGTDGKFEQEAYEALKELSEYHRSGFQRFVDWIKELINKIKGQPTFKDMADELEYLNKQIAKVYDSRINESSNNTIKFSLMNSLSFSQNVDNILKMSDEEADKNKKEGNFVSILKNTPQIILDNVIGAEDLEIIISFHSLYLETRHEGCLEGTYHNLGEQIKQLPELISNPEAIVRMKDGRINILTTLETIKGKNGTVSVELSTVKDINNKNNKYNLVITVFSSKDSYILNNLLKNGDYVEYKKEDLSQVNPQLHKSLTTFNEKSSIDSIPDNSPTVKGNSDSTESHSIAVPFSEEFKADKRKRYAKSLVKKYGGDINGAELENYLKEISIAAEHRDYAAAYTKACEAAYYIAHNSSFVLERAVYKKKIHQLFSQFFTKDIIVDNRTELKGKFIEATELLIECYDNPFADEQYEAAEAILEELATYIAGANNTELEKSKARVESIKDNMIDSIYRIWQQSVNNSSVKAEENLAEKIFDMAVYNRTEELSYKASESQRKLAEKRQKELNNKKTQLDSYLNDPEKINRKAVRETVRKELNAREEFQDRHKNIEHIKRVVRRLHRKLKTNSNALHIPEQFKDLVADVCKMFAKADNEKFAGSDFHKIEKHYKKLSNVDGFEEEILNCIETLEERAEQVDGVSVLEMDFYDVFKLRCILDNINHIIVHSEEMFVNGKKQEKEKLLEKAFTELYDKKNITNNASIEFFRGFLKYDNMTPVHFFESIGGVLETLYKDVRTGFEKVSKNLLGIRSFFQETIEKYNFDNWKDNEIEIITHAGVTLRFTVDEALLIYATAKREKSSTSKNTEHLIEGGITHSRDEKLSKILKRLNYEAKHSGRKTKIEELFYDEVKNKAIAISEWDIEEIVSKLTQQQKNYADTVVKYLSEDMAQLGNETSMQLYGYYKFNETYYIPFNSDRRFLESKLSYSPDATLKNWSATKNTVDKAATPLVIEGFTQVAARHCNKMATYNGLTVALENLNSVYNSGVRFKLSELDMVLQNSSKYSQASIKSLVTEKYGVNANKYIEQFIKDMNGDARINQGEGFVNALIRKFKANAVMASASVVIQQPASIGRAIAYIEPKYFFGAKSGKGDYEQLKKYCGAAVFKEMGRFDTGMGLGTVDWLLKTTPKGLKNKTTAFITNKQGYRDEKFSFLAGKADEVTWSWIWQAAKNKIAAETDLDVNSEEFLIKAGEFASEVIDKTQVYDTTITRSQNMRSTSTFMKIATSFMAEPTLTLNLLYSAAQDFSNGKTKNGLSKLSAVTVTAILTAILKSIVTAARDDDEYKSYIEKYLSDVATETVDNLLPFNMLPYIRDIYSIFQGYDVKRPDMELFDSLVSSFKTIADSDENIGKKLDVFLDATGAFIGVPYKNISRDIMAVVNTGKSFIQGENKTTADGIWYAILEDLPIGTKKDSKSVNYDRLLSAAESGDKEKFDKVKDHLEELGEDDAAIKSGLKKSIKKNSDEYQDDFQDYMNKLYRIAFFDNLSAEEKKKVENNISNFVAEEIVTDIIGEEPEKKGEKKKTDPYDNVREAENKGIGAEYYYLSKIATNEDNADYNKNGSVTKKEKLRAVREMDLPSDIKAALIALYR